MKLIATLYFYTLSLIGFVLLLIGVFDSIHYYVGATQFPEYPLGYSTASRCLPAAPLTQNDKMQLENSTYYIDCMKGVAQDREELQTTDLEKAISFTSIGLIVFLIHFYYARKRK